MSKKRDLEHEANRRAPTPWDDKPTASEMAEELVERPAEVVAAEVQELADEEREAEESAVRDAAERIDGHWMRMVREGVGLAARGIDGIREALEGIAIDDESGAMLLAEASLDALEARIKRVRSTKFKR